MTSNKGTLTAAYGPGMFRSLVVALVETRPPHELHFTPEHLHTYRRTATSADAGRRKHGNARRRHRSMRKGCASIRVTLLEGKATKTGRRKTRWDHKARSSSTHCRVKMPLLKTWSRLFLPTLLLLMWLSLTWMPKNRTDMINHADAMVASNKKWREQKWRSAFDLQENTTIKKRHPHTLTQR